jgi:hypothetical protein
MCRQIVLIIVCIATFACALRAQPTISFTFDDGVTNDMPGAPFKQWNRSILGHLDNAGIKAIFFVTGINKSDEKGRFLLASWNAKGHKIGNHTFSHLNYNSKSVTFEKFSAEFLRTDSIINSLSNYIRMFRFPYLKEGDTREKIDRFRAFLMAHGYKNGFVTVDASDWYVDSRLRKRLIENPNAGIAGFRQFYLDHIYNRAQYYNDLGMKLNGRQIKHTLLLHHNLASSLFLGDLIKMFRDKGWKVIDAEEAYTDDIFKTVPTIIPAGESLLWALAKASGKFDQSLRYPAEDSRYEKDAMDKLGL